MNYDAHRATSFYSTKIAQTSPLPWGNDPLGQSKIIARYLIHCIYEDVNYIYFAKSLGIVY